MKPLELEEVRAAARLEVEARGRDFRYILPRKTGEDFIQCFYVPRSHPYFPGTDDTLPPSVEVTGCLVGQILERTGRMTRKVAEHLGDITAMCAQGVVVATPDAMRYLQGLQNEQDGGMNWGTALDRAEQEFA